MTILECRRDRLVHVLDLARMYRGWTRQEVAAALGREPSKMIPESGNPKLDLVVGIARLLEWQVGEVAACLWGESIHHESDALDGFAQRPGSPDASNTDGAGRAESLRNLAARCRSQGRYEREIGLLQQALLERSLSFERRTHVMAELAAAHATLWHLAEARALASENLRQLRRAGEATAGGLPNGFSHPLALSRAVRGHVHRRLMRMEADPSHRHAAAARADLVEAIAAIDRLLGATAVTSATPATAASTTNESTGRASVDELLALAHAARGGIVECDVELGALAPDEGVAQLLRGLDHVVDPESLEPGPMLESWGWWSVYGANVTLAHFSGSALQRTLAIFTNKALEIADRTGNWALRERAFMLEHKRRAHESGESGEAAELTLLDHEDVRSIIGTMGRFAPFRETGWALLRSASIID